ncbi:hypothetical protein Tco_0431197 [Tanacetum coccineum]
MMTCARIMTESVPEPARTIRQSSIAFRDTSSMSKKRTSDTSQKLKVIQSLTPVKQEAADIMKALKDSKKIIGRQPGTGGSDEGIGEIPRVPDESIFADAEDDNEETESDSDDIYMYRINGRKNADIKIKDAEKTADITKETVEQPLTSSSFSVPSCFAITTAIPRKYLPFIALQLRVAKLEQDMSERRLQKTVKTINRKHDGDEVDDVDDEGPLASSKTRGKDPKVGSKTGKSAPAKDPVFEELLKRCLWIGKEELSKADLEGPTFMMVKGFHENSISLQFQMEECHKLLTNQIDLVNPEGHRIVPDISNPLPLGGPPAALYQDFGLEELVSSLWIESEREYDISAAYGITHWWFSRKQFYINKHSEPSDRDAVRSHMRILGVISIKTYERYG